METLPEPQQMAVFKKAEQRLIRGQLDADALRQRLEELTPPPDPEEDAEECRILEAQARQDLENDGCPPCYPPELDVPVRDPPEELRQIIEYWRSRTSGDDVVLCAQRSDWRRFREWQQRVRLRYRNRPFSTFLDNVRERRQRHGLDGDVELLLDWQQQSREQTWIEFQDYHLRLHESQTMERDELRETRLAPLRLEYAERTLRQHEVLMSWIEQRRVLMKTPPATPVGKGSADLNSSPALQRRSKRLNPPSVLGKVRVSKSTTHGQDKVRKCTSTAPARKPSSADTAGSTPPMSACREPRPRRAKEKALSQLLSQKVAKASRATETVVKPPFRKQSGAAGSIRQCARPPRPSASHPLQSTPKIIRTRSQRISREPVRWVPT